uniref:Threonine--tRNA ligase n=1 Tax=Candidatus Aschnera chinzeii TaxID=1485666 RepID=A0AAT9G4V2_9ENTR|nr:MAG: threonine--tRNA ligase [Candidatus Aschnera chinzeii]
MPIITFYDGNQYNYSHSVAIIDIIKQIDPNLIKDCVAFKINGNIIDILEVINQDVYLEIIKITDIDALNIIRKSCAYLLGCAIKYLWPMAKMGIGDSVDDGFYYDIDLAYSLTQKDLNDVEYCMNRLINKNINFVKKKVSWKEAREIFLLRDEQYKINILDEHFDKNIFFTLYYHNQYIDMFHGPLVSNINYCSNFKLQKISGAYWCGDHNNKMLQRIYGIAWNTKKQLSTYLIQLEEAKKRDHRKIGKELNLYHLQDEAPGMVFWHHNGWIVFRELQEFIRNKLKEFNYQEVKTPLIIDQILWKQTGHWENYKNNMLITSSEKHTFCIKPMNCPGHIQIYNQTIKSYRDLPLRIAEFGSCHRNESSGSLHGLMRIREFTQDDAHIFCTENQVLHEVTNCIKMIFNVYEVFGFKKISVKLSTKPKKCIGDDKQWERAENDLAIALNNIKFEYQHGEGAFYGPKIEFILHDSLNRQWQCGTVQLDFSLPIKLHVNYIDNKNVYQTPVIIHRAILGSLERFIGILIEEYNGYFPTWLAPIQIMIINISHTHINYTKTIKNILSNMGIRAHADIRNEKINFKIRAHTLQRIPYILICGNKEVTTNQVTVRTCYGKNLGTINIQTFAKIILNEIKEHKISQMEELKY